jgi:hypothetical protein
MIHGVVTRAGVAVDLYLPLPADKPTDERPVDRQAEDVAEVVRELARRATEYGLVAEPVLAGEQLGAALVTRLAFEPRFGTGPAKLRGVIGFDGVYEAPHARFRAALRTVFGEMARDLEPWPAATYDAIDLGRDHERAR